MFQSGLPSDGLRQTAMIHDRSGIPAILHSNHAGVLYICVVETADTGAGEKRGLSKSKYNNPEKPVVFLRPPTISSSDNLNRLIVSVNHCFKQNV